MNKSISHNLVVFPLVASLLATQVSLAAFNNPFVRKQSLVVSDAHPCAKEMKLEIRQIEIMEHTARVINSDAGLRTAMQTGMAVSDASDATAAAFSGNKSQAILDIVSSLIRSGIAVKNGTDGIKKGFSLASMIQERKENVRLLIENPNKCSIEVVKNYAKLYVSETLQRNTQFASLLDASIKKAEGNVHITMDLVSLSVGTAAAIAAFVIFKKDGVDMGTKWLGGILAIVGVLGIGTGAISGLGDITYNIPTLNDLKAQKVQMDGINAELSEQLKSL